MTRDQLASQMAEKLDISKAKADQVVKVFLEQIAETLANGETIQFTGFGSFSVRERAARTGRNPQTGETIDLPAKRVAVFKPGKDLNRVVGHQ